jgi:copper/silver efflux system protein
MMDKIIRFSVGSPWMLIFGLLLVGVFGWTSLQQTPVDAFPDISENQTIVFTEWMGRSPQDVEDQITYPLSAELKAISGVKEVRGMSGFGFSQIYVIFEDDIDFFWARSRVLERLSTAQKSLPNGVSPQLGPEATALGQIFWYTLEGPGYDLGTLRSLQDFYVKLALQSVDGVAQVASVGGFVRQYQIDVDVNKLKAYDVDINAVIAAVRGGNIDVGAKTIESSGLEAVIRGVGFIKRPADVEDLVITSRDGTPVFVRNVATVKLGPDFRRGALADAHGERVGGVVAMRFGANPQAVIEGLHARISELEVGLPEGVRVVPFYDRSILIHETTATLITSLTEELIITIAVVMLFLLHFRSSLVIASTLPLAVLMAFIGMRAVGIGADIMSLSGIAIAIGTAVDMGIIMSENIFSALTALPPDRRDDASRSQAIIQAAGEVGPAILTAVATTIFSFLPVFYLTGQSGKLFKPLAWTKTFAMASAVILAITLVPALCRLFVKDSTAIRAKARWLTIAAFAGIGALVGWRLPELGASFAEVQPWLTALFSALLLGWMSWRVSTERLTPLDENAVSRGIIKLYQPLLRWVLTHRALFLVAPVVVTLLGVLIFTGARTFTAPLTPLAEAVGLDLQRLRLVQWAQARFPGVGSEFMPPLDEGSYLAMPSTLAQASLSQTMEVMQRMNAEIASIPEVAQVVGKLGRADTALDPAPVGMIESVVNLKPPSEWRPGITRDDILQELKRKSRIIGTTPSWLQPIETRIVMLQSGIRATMAIRLRGAPRRPNGSAYTSAESLRIMEQAVVQMEDVIRAVPGAIDVTALRLGGKPYVEFEINRAAIARYAVKVRDVQTIIETAIGGLNLDWSLEGRERYPIRVQYARELRDDYADLPRVLVPTPSGAQIPLGDLTTITYRLGPAAIRTENGQLTAYLMFNAFQRDEAAVIHDALQAVSDWRAQTLAATGQDPVPAGLTVSPTGRYKNKVEADKRLMLIIPIVLLINFFLIYLQFRSFSLTAILYTAIPVAFGGGFLMIALYPDLLDLLCSLGIRDQPSAGPVYLTTAVWVGFIALFGLAVDDGVVIGTYLQQVFSEQPVHNMEALHDAIVQACTRRIRPMMMTTSTTILALAPVLWSGGRGADLMQPMTLPLIGGMSFAFITVFMVPVMVSMLMERRLRLTGQCVL